MLKIKKKDYKPKQMEIGIEYDGRVRSPKLD